MYLVLAANTHLSIIVSREWFPLVIFPQKVFEMLPFWELDSKGARKKKEKELTRILTVECNDHCIEKFSSS